MPNSRLQHGFTRVDEEARPAAWVECLDKLHGEPFYRDYKDRIRAILAPRATGLYLDVGAGVATDAMALGAKVIAIDRSLTMCRESRARGHAMSVAANAEALPFPSGLVDGCWSNRTFQHLIHPQRALEELTRVMKRGAVIVVADPDYGTQAMPFPDQGLARRVLDFRAQHALQNGTLAHEIGSRFVEAGLEDVSVEERRLIVRDPTSIDRDGSTVLGPHCLRSRDTERRRGGALGNTVRPSRRGGRVSVVRILLHHEWPQARRPCARS